MTFPVPPGVAGLLGLNDEETWEDRIVKAAYTSPGGTRIEFDWEVVSRSTERRDQKFSFRNVNDDYVQQNGFGSRKYPLRCFFNGENCDRLATAFEQALLEPGRGKLDHPLYGTFFVVPFGEILRQDNLKDGANQSVVEVTFWTSLKEVYPRAGSNPKNEILDSIAGFNVALAQQFDDSVDFDGTLKSVSALGTIRDFIDQVSGTMGKVSGQVTAVNQEFLDIQSTLNYGMDTFIGAPLLLAQQVSNLSQAPAKALTSIRSRLEAYDSLAESIFGSDAGNPASALASGTALALRQTQVSNDFHSSDLFAMNAVAGSIVSVVNNQFSTKPEALGAADAVLTQLDALTAWRESGFEALEALPISVAQVDTGGAYQALRQAAALTAGFLVEISFSLVPEYQTILDRDRTVLDLSAELYGSTSNETLDFLISSNDLSGDQILELPRGTLIKYYPS